MLQMNTNRGVSGETVYKNALNVDNCMRDVNECVLLSIFRDRVSLVSSCAAFLPIPYPTHIVFDCLLYLLLNI